MFIGAMEFDLLLGDVRSLKDKRAVLRPVLEALRRCDVSVAEVADHDLHRRARVGVAVTSGDAEHCGQVLDRCERLVAERPELELLSCGRRIFALADGD
jgi:uncharacterized protein YlxP (DUF503 family)